MQGRRAARVVMHDVSLRRRAEAVRTATLRIAEAAQAAQRLDDLYRVIHSIVGELMPAENFFIALYDEASQTLIYPYGVDERDSDWRSHRIGKGLTAHVLRTGQSLLAPPEVFAEMVQRGEAELFGPAAIDWLGVPLRAGDKVIGAVAVQTYTEAVRLTEDDRRILEFVSTQVAMRWLSSVAGPRRMSSVAMQFWRRSPLRPSSSCAGRPGKRLCNRCWSDWATRPVSAECISCKM